MGSANCKEYATSSKQGDSSLQQNGNGTSGSYQSTCEANMSEYTDAVTVCNEADIQENEMKQMSFDENTKILLIKQNGTLTAIGNKCTHYGAPLNTGALGQGRVRCPWHGACFDIVTGDIEDFPGLDSLPCYLVQVERDGQVKIRAKRKDLDKNKRLKDMAKRVQSNDKCYVVVGGGPAGAVCAETLRQEGFTGRIVMICKENNLPYDRVKISKSMNIDVATIQFRDAAFYEEHSIEVMLGVSATKLNASEKSVECSNGYSIKYDKIFIATGCNSRHLEIEGSQLNKVFTLRDHSEANNIASFVNPEMHAVCLGGSFISMEAAAYLTGKVKSVTVINRDSVPFLPSFGNDIGNRMLKLYEEKGVNMIGNSGIKKIIGNDNGDVKEVMLLDGSTIPCDLLIVGIGSVFYTDFLRNSGVTINSNGSIDTDMHLMTNIPDIYVGGDIANAPIFSNANQRGTIGHFQLAQYHGRIAALNMTGTIEDLRAVPFFFTMVFGKGIRYSGYGKYSSVFIDGDLEAFKFAAYYLDANDNVVAVASCGRDPIVAQFAELQYQGKRLHRSDIEGKEDPSAWTQMLKDSRKARCVC